MEALSYIKNLAATNADVDVVVGMVAFLVMGFLAMFIIKPEPVFDALAPILVPLIRWALLIGFVYALGVLRGR